MTNQEWIRSLDNYARNLRYSDYNEVQAQLAKFPREELASRLTGRKTGFKWHGVTHGNHNMQPLFTHQEVVEVVRIISTIPRGPKIEAPREKVNLQGDAKKAAESKRKEFDTKARKEEEYWPNFLKSPQGLGYFLGETSEGSALFHLMDKPITTTDYAHAIYTVWHHGQRRSSNRTKDLAGQIAGCATGATILGLALFGLKKLVVRG